MIDGRSHRTSLDRISLGSRRSWAMRVVNKGLLGGIPEGLLGGIPVRLVVQDRKLSRCIPGGWASSHACWVVSEVKDHFDLQYIT